MSLTTAIVSVGSTVGGQVYSYQQSKEAAKEQKEAGRLERIRAEAQNTRNIRRAAAQAQIQRARLEATQAASASASSGTQGQMGAINTQLGNEIGFQQGQSSLANQIQDRLNDANKFAGKASVGQAVSNLPSQLGFSLGSVLRG
jgi:outer membrane protein OmpA-like peptidoglycan-associated protein